MKRKRGRPFGSKNKPKYEIPQENRNVSKLLDLLKYAQENQDKLDKIKKILEG